MMFVFVVNFGLGRKWWMSCKSCQISAGEEKKLRTFGYRQRGLM
jgi:hypothetical protein